MSFFVVVVVVLLSACTLLSGSHLHLTQQTSLSPSPSPSTPSSLLMSRCYQQLSLLQMSTSLHTHTRTPRHVLRALQCNLNSIENPRTSNQHKLQCDGNVYTHELITKSVVSTCTDTLTHTHSVRVCIVTEKKQDHIANVSEQRVTDREIEN